MDRPIVHLVCQAHIDPIWMWTWEEGAREAISTFRTACNLLEAFPEFVFNHNESLLYEWVEEYDPPLFERLCGLVQQGRWHITGGWYLQPDLNLLGGETLVRLILEGRRYFKERFDARPTVSYNFDTFGHPGTLPQILRRSGFDMYIHCRPLPRQMELPAALYAWHSPDGSAVMALRPDAGWYCTPGPGQAQAQARQGIEIARRTGSDTLVLWGLGDHGGGATREDLEAFRALFEEFAGSDIEIRHSTPEAYLERVRRQTVELPQKHGELQRTLSGCYTSVAPIKRQMREGEALLASAERWAAIAWWRFGWKYPAAELREAWKRLMLNSFHDALCGSLLEEALLGVNDMFGYAHDVARRVIVRSQHALIPNVAPSEGTIPLYVFNPHAAPMRGHVGLNLIEYRQPLQKKVLSLFDDQGAEVVYQLSGGPAVLETGAWQPYVGFIADLPPLSARRYEVRYQQPTAQAANRINAAEDADGITVETPFWTARFAADLAAPVELIDRQTGKTLLKGPIRLFAMQDVGNAWGGEDWATYNVPVAPLSALSPEDVGAFQGLEGRTGPALRVIARGEVSITVECLVGWQHTRAAIRFTFYADLPYLDIDTRLYMNARRKMIKLQFPFDLPGVRAACEVPYGVAERAADATEWPNARWVRLDGADASVGVANSGQNGFDVSPDGLLNLSISRGAIHCSAEDDVATAPTSAAVDLARSYTWMDQEQIDTRFRLLAGKDVAAALHLAALELNQPLERFFAFFPPSTPEERANIPPFLAVEPATIELGALKKAEGEEALIVRLVETAGAPTSARIALDGGAAQVIQFGPYAIRTFKVTRGGGWEEVNLVEEALGNNP